MDCLHLATGSAFAYSLLPWPTSPHWAVDLTSTSSGNEPAPVPVPLERALVLGAIATAKVDLDGQFHLHL